VLCVPSDFGERIDVQPVQEKQKHRVAAIESTGPVTEVVNPPEELRTKVKADGLLLKLLPPDSSGPAGAKAPRMPAKNRGWPHQEAHALVARRLSFRMASKRELLDGNCREIAKCDRWPEENGERLMALVRTRTPLRNGH
jgi:hypothetical protein